jgi:hypothetical protein
MKIRTKLAGIALSAVLLVFSAGTAVANGFDNECRARIDKEQRDLYRAERLYGPYSWQANEERDELRWLFDRCGYSGYNYYGGNEFYFRGNLFVNPHRDRDRDDHMRHRDRDHDRDDHRRDHDADRDRR